MNVKFSFYRLSGAILLLSMILLIGCNEENEVPVFETSAEYQIIGELIDDNTGNKVQINNSLVAINMSINKKQEFQSVQTNDGNYAFPSVKKGKVNILAFVPGYEDAKMTIDLSNQPKDEPIKVNVNVKRKINTGNLEVPGNKIIKIDPTTGLSKESINFEIVCRGTGTDPVTTSNTFTLPEGTAIKVNGEPAVGDLPLVATMNIAVEKNSFTNRDISAKAMGIQFNMSNIEFSKPLVIKIQSPWGKSGNRNIIGFNSFELLSSESFTASSFTAINGTIDISGDSYIVQLNSIASPFFKGIVYFINKEPETVIVPTTTSYFLNDLHRSIMSPYFTCGHRSGISTQPLEEVYGQALIQFSNELLNVTETAIKVKFGSLTSDYKEVKYQATDVLVEAGYTLPVEVGHSTTNYSLDLNIKSIEHVYFNIVERHSETIHILSPKIWSGDYHGRLTEN